MSDIAGLDHARDSADRLAAAMMGFVALSTSYGRTDLPDGRRWWIPVNSRAKK
jgi:hypothetical protein